MDNVDMFGLLIPLTFDGVKLVPYGIIAAIEPNAFRDGDGDHFGNFVGVSSSQPRAGLLPHPPLPSASPA